MPAEDDMTDSRRLGGAIRRSELTAGGVGTVQVRQDVQVSL